MALAIAAWAVGLELTVSNVLPVIRTFARYPLARWGVATVVATVIPVLFLALAQILFLVALRRELEGSISANVRRRYAMVAVIGEVMKLLFALGTAWNVRPFHPVLYWSEFIAFGIVPSLCWMALLWIFWKEASPISFKYTRFLAGLLCAFELLLGLRGSYAMVGRMAGRVSLPAFPGGSYVSAGRNLWDSGVAPAIGTLAWVSLAFFLFALCRETRSTGGARGSTARP